MTTRPQHFTELSPPRPARRPRQRLRTVVAAMVLAAGAGACGMEGDPAAEEAEQAAAGIVFPAAYQVHLNRRVLAQLPRSADLVLDGHMRFYVRTAVEVGLQIDVHNVGDVSATGNGARVRVAGRELAAELYPYWTGTVPTNPGLLPGARGYIKVVLPAGVLAPCTRYDVQIDLGRTMQSGPPDPFTNDSGSVLTQCLTWQQPYRAAVVHADVNPLVEGRSLEQIVGSFVVARDDGRRCSSCHYQGSGRAYAPAVAANGSAVIGPWEYIGGRTWAGAGGWGERFLGRADKPHHLKALFQLWRDTGSAL